MNYIKLMKSSFFISTDIDKPVVTPAYIPSVIHSAEGRIDIELSGNYQYAMAA